MPNRSLDRKYEYRRKLPHDQKAGRVLFVTFCRGNRVPFSSEARDAVLRHTVCMITGDAFNFMLRL